MSSVREDWGPRERLFIDSFLKLGKVAPACRQSGLSRMAAARLLKSERFKKRLSAWMKQQQVMSRQEVLSEISALASRSLEDCRITITTKSGAVVTRIDRALLSAKVRALEMLARIYRMMDDDKPEVGTVTVEYRFIPYTATKGWLTTADEDDESSDFDAGARSTGSEAIVDQLGTDRMPLFRTRLKGQP
jgi:hypothetical protein